MLFDEVSRALEHAWAEIEKGPVFPDASLEEIRAELSPFDFEKAVEPLEVLRFASEGMQTHHLRISHPCYFGVFNPHPTVMGIVADALVSGMNPQLASWTSAPFAIELEQHTLRKLGAMFGYAENGCEGTFTQGGTEANHTAVLVALYDRFPEAKKSGIRGISGLPTLHVSKEAHHSFVKAARACGLGDDSVREVEPKDLARTISNDRSEGCIPFFVAGTAGTTSGGEIEPLKEIASIASTENLWFHCDAAWGGAAMVSVSLRKYFDGIALADSITFDAHKWFNAPMTAGIFLSRHLGVLEKTFRVGHTPYMPASSQRSEKHQPYAESLAWSRRFLGLKVFAALAVSGWKGQEEMILHQVRMAEKLREKLMGAGWNVLNKTPLPVVCFTRSDLDTPEKVESLSATVAATGEAWITTTSLAGVPCLRAGISNFKTEEKHLDVLIDLLGRI